MPDASMTDSTAVRRSIAKASSAPPTLASPIESLHGIGPTRARELRFLGLHQLGDLLEYFPRDYVFESAEGSISGLVADQIHTARGEVVAVNYIPTRPRPRFEATLDDNSGKLALVWFNQRYLRTRIHPGQTIRVRGRVKVFRGLPQMADPKWAIGDPGTEAVTAERFRPIYPATAHLPSELIGSIIDSSLDAAVRHVEEWFDPALLSKRHLISRREAYVKIHRPANFQE